MKCNDNSYPDTENLLKSHSNNFHHNEREKERKEERKKEKTRLENVSSSNEGQCLSNDIA